MKAMTSRPLLLAAVGTAANHAGQTTLHLTPLHGKANILKRSSPISARPCATFRGCEAVLQHRPLGLPVALRQRQDRTRLWASKAADRAGGDGVTADLSSELYAWIHDDCTTWFKTRRDVEIASGVNPGTVHELLKGTVRRSKGWRLFPTPAPLR